MDKAILKKFAIESRKDLMEKIKNKINTFYIDEEFKKEQKGEIYVLSNEKHSLSLTNEEYQKRELLIKRIKELSLEQVIEEAAYTWFNRIIAIRYMEINDYLPLTKDNQSLGIRVLSSKDNTPDPEILKFTNLINPDLDINFKKEKYVELKNDNEKFKYILLLVCKKLGRVIPQVFDGITDYIDILIPDNLLNDTGFITKIINEVPEDNYNKVEIIGWLYQYYISEKKDEVFKDLKNNIKISKKDIPAATQLFTPEWIVEYMVQNTLGQLYERKDNLKYYIKNNLNYDNDKIEEIKFLDPCCGSGHILVCAFDMFYKIYEENGYPKNEITEKIIKNNIYGIDIDERACQLSNLAIMLRARKYDKNVFNKNIIPNIISINESNTIDDIELGEIDYFSNKEQIIKIVEQSKDAKEFGSILLTEKIDVEQIIKELNNVDNIFRYGLRSKLLPLLIQNSILNDKYDFVVTNPPYMGAKGMSDKLTKYLKKNYPDSKTDMFSVFIEVAKHLTKTNGYYAMITQPSILFLSSFEKLREKIINEQTICSLLHMGRGIFGVDFGSTAFVIKNCIVPEYIGDYFRLHQRTFQYIDVNDIEKLFLNSKNNINYEYDFSNYKFSANNELENDNILDENEISGNIKIHYKVNQNNFKVIPGNGIAYWVNYDILKLFEEKSIKDVADIRQGLITGDNDKFLRLWYEVSAEKFSIYSKNENTKWFPINKGGNFRKWYGNKDYVVNWENDGYEIKNFKNEKGKLKSRPQNLNYNFKKAISWSLIASKNFGVRLYDENFMFNVAGISAFVDDEYFKYLLGFLNTKICNVYTKILNPTINMNVGDIEKIPFIYNEFKSDEIIKIVDECVSIAKEDWDMFEISWDFMKHPLIVNKQISLKMNYEYFTKLKQDNFDKMVMLESKLNDIFIDIYSLKNVIDDKVNENTITLCLADREREIKSLISYAVGCMFGRYSLDKEGLIYAGGDFDEIYKKCKKTDGGWAGISLSNYKVLTDNEKEIDLSFEVDNDNVIPITDESYFSDDIVERFKTFISVVYGEKTLNENLDLIAETLGKKGTETSEDTIRRYFVNDFFNDHVKTYQKRPIYWLFDSGKKNGFKALVYMHRYNENLIPKVRLDYLHRMQTTYEKLLTDVNDKLTSELSMTDKKEAQKRQADLNAKLQEIREYDEKIAHIANQRISIDLDDGVKVNYDKFKDILAKIK